MRAFICTIHGIVQTKSDTLDSITTGQAVVQLKMCTICNANPFILMRDGRSFYRFRRLWTSPSPVKTLQPLPVISPLQSLYVILFVEVVGDVSSLCTHHTVSNLCSQRNIYRKQIAYFKPPLLSVNGEYLFAPRKGASMCDGNDVGGEAKDSCKQIKQFTDSVQHAYTISRL